VIRQDHLVGERADNRARLPVYLHQMAAATAMWSSIADLKHTLALTCHSAVATRCCLLLITGQIGASRRLFASRERTIFQAIPEASISDRLDCPQLESAGGTCC